VDRAVVTFLRAPATYSGEDMVEISGHGGWLAPALVLEACVGAGARQAEPGEFTRRAYLNGKLDLIQAEAVLDLVEGRSRALHDAALHHLERGLSRRISDVREGLVGLEALLAHHIDFPEEDQPPVPKARVLEAAERVRDALATILRTAPEGELLREGALTVLAGRPNAGKSSLFNALIGEERAIVTELPGTTRDAVEVAVSLGGFPFRLVDTAGLRDSDERVERLGIEVARRFLGRADLVLLCLEAGAEPDAAERRFLEEMGEKPVVLVRTKSDLAPSVRSPDAGEADPWSAGRASAGRVDVSVVTGEGLGALEELLPSLVYGGLVRGGGDVPVLTRARQSAAVGVALEEVTAFANALASGVPAELAATHLRPAESALEELLGIISPDDVLDRLFREFCIGK
jgi:tRNA modification GTPase